MKKKSNRNLLTKYTTKIVLDKKELEAKRISQIEAQKKILDFKGKLRFRMIMNIEKLHSLIL